MEKDKIAAPTNKDDLQNSVTGENQIQRVTFLGLWYRYCAPPELSVTASYSQREKARRGRLASITVLLMIFFVLAMLPQAIIYKDTAQIVAPLLGTGICFLALFLNRRGFLVISGTIMLVLLYAGETFTVLGIPGGLTTGNLTMLDFTVVPDVLVLAFFSANSLFPFAGINLFITWVLVVYGPHDATITRLLQNAPSQIFAHVYILQLITAAAMYLWARSFEQALKRADRAEEIAAFRKRESERNQRELEQKHQLDMGIQQILQTHVAVANGDFKVRAPLSKDHMLWQVAVALNNLIARLQSLSYLEKELKHQTREVKVYPAGQHVRHEP